jgi:hypothetical protein
MVRRKRAPARSPRTPAADVALRNICNQPGSFFAIFKSIRRMRKRPARAIDAVAFHQVVQDAPARLKQPAFRHDLPSRSYLDYQQS